MTTLTSTLPCVPLSAIALAAPTLLRCLNSKGRPMPVHLMGPPGVGKTMFAVDVARREALSMPGVPYGLAIHNLSIAAPTDVPGVMLFDTQGGATRATYTTPVVFRISKVFYAPEGSTTLDDVLECPAVTPEGGALYAGGMVSILTPNASQPITAKLRDGLIVLDEFMQAEADTRAAAAPLLDEGRAGIHTLPDGFAVWALSNRAKDQSGTKKALAFLTNRACQMEVTPSQDSLLAYFEGESDTTASHAVRMGLDPHHPMLPSYDSHHPRESSRSPLRRRPMHPAVLAFARDSMAKMVEAEVPTAAGMPFLTPRSFEMASNVLDAFLRDEGGTLMTHDSDDESYQFRRAMALDVIGGLIGPADAAAMFGFVDLYHMLPTVPQIVANPKVEFLERSDAQVILAYRVAEAMDVKNAKPLLAFLKRLDDAYAMLAVTKAFTKAGGRSLYTVPEFKAFFAQNPDQLARLTMMAPRGDGTKPRVARR